MLTKAFLSIIALTLLSAMLLAGCSASGEPRLIAAFPSGVPQPPPAPPPSPPTYPQPPQVFVYNAWLAIEAWYPDRAALRAGELAARHGGYLVSSHSWHVQGEEHLTIVLAVPVYNFQALYGDLQDLGKVVGEQVWGEWQSASRYGPGGVPNYSQITLEVAPRAFKLPSLSLGGWNPGRTFASALRVSAAIFRFVVDAFIWLLVVVAPFVLIVLGLRFVIKKLRQ